MRKFLNGLSTSEWEQVINGTHSFEAAMQTAGGKSVAVVDERTVQMWVRLKQRSDKMLEYAVRGTAWQLIVETHEDDGTLPIEPEEVGNWLAAVSREDLERWIAGVAATHGSGPAKVCLLAGVEADDSSVGESDVDDLLSLIASTPFVGPNQDGEQASHVLNLPSGDGSESVTAEGVTDVAQEPEEPGALPGESYGRPVDGADGARASMRSSIIYPDLDAIAARLADAQAAGVDTAQQLRIAAADVEAGREHTGDLGAMMGAFLDARSALVTDIATIQPSVDLDTFAACHVALDAERRAREESRSRAEAVAQDRAEQIRRARADLGRLEELIASENQSLVVGFQELRDAKSRELAEMLAETPEEDNRHVIAALEAAGSLAADIDRAVTAERAELRAVREATTSSEKEPVDGSESAQAPGANEVEPPSGPSVEGDGVAVTCPTAGADESSMTIQQAQPNGTHADMGMSSPTGVSAAGMAVAHEGPSGQDAAQLGQDEAPAPDEVAAVSPERTNAGGVGAEVVASLVAQSRPIAASWLVRASGSSPALADALLFNGVALASGSDSVSPADAMLHGAGLDVESLGGERLAALAAMTGAARAGLAAGWADRNLLDDLLAVVHLEPEWQALFDAVVEVSHHGYQHSVTRDSDPTWIPREGFAEMARNLSVELESATTKYHRATKVLHFLARSDEPLGASLRAVTAWSAGDDSVAPTIRELAASLRDDRSRSRLIDAADERVSSPQQRRKEIVAGAAQQLNSRIGEVAGLLTAALEAMVRPQGGAADEADTRALVKAAEVVPGSGDVTDPDVALLAALRTWILEPSGARAEVGTTVTELAWRASLPLVELHRDAEQSPVFDGATVAELASAMLHPPSPEELVDGYVKRGNLPAAAAVAEGETTLRDRVVDASGDWRARLAGLVREAETQLARARSHHAMEDEEVSATEGRLRALTQYEGDRFDLQVEEVASIKSMLADRLRRVAARLYEDLEGVVDAAAGDVERVRHLIEDGDLATAREYTFQLRRGERLPSLRDTGVDHLQAFNDLVDGLPAGAKRAQDIYDRLSHDASDELAGAGLQAWASVVLNPLRSTKQVLPAVLSLIGLETQRGGVADVNAKGAGGDRVFEVRAQPRDGSIVPALGSRAHARYHVTVVSPRRLDPEQVLRLIPESRRDAANLILVPLLLTLQERRQFLRVARHLGVKALLIDSACIGYMAAAAPGSFQVLQQVTLPYATYSHYTPFVAGDVPEEVFVGRTEEARQIVDPAGSLFVYGGRQLGKSALLRHIARTSSDGRARHAIYVDLKAKMIGEAHDPSHLWVVLLEEFKRAGIIGPTATSGTAASVVEHTKAWLREDETRTLLLLLDEADLFLESEARQRREAQRVVRFPNISPLKDLMESTNRRFKPVFAGLHQVQRFHEISNTPLAHGGNDILVGSLDRDSGFELVERPFEALGFRFESRDLVARLLAFANYQASLVQIVCDHLARTLTKRAPGAGQPPVTITSSDIDRVTENRDVRHQLAERFRLTVALEDRYLVIALVVALLSFDDGFTESYDEQDVFSWCRDYWPAGFGDMTQREFRLYLEEMHGLGVLVRRTDERIAVRSPNVVSMLGKKADLEQQLEEGRFELPHDYNPRASRRLVRIRQRLVRSPLTEQDLRILLPKTGGSPGLHLVLGSEALGIDHVVDVLGAVATERDRATVSVKAASFADWVTSSGAGPARDRDTVPLVDATGADDGDAERVLELAMRTVSRRAGQSIIVVLGAAFAAHLESWSSRAGVASVTTLVRLNDEALRSMNEAVFVDIAQYRSQILEATNGWPALVEQVLLSGSKGEPLDSILDSLGSQPSDASASTAFLKGVGVGVDGLGERLADWVDATSPGDRVDPRDLDELYADAPPGTFSSIAATLAVLDAVTGEAPTLLLDPVVRRAVRSTLDAGD